MVPPLLRISEANAVYLPFTLLLACAARHESTSDIVGYQAFDTTMERALATTAQDAASPQGWWYLPVPESFARDVAGSAGVTACLEGLKVDVRSCMTRLSDGVTLRMMLVEDRLEWSVQFDPLSPPDAPQTWHIGRRVGEGDAVEGAWEQY